MMWIAGIVALVVLLIVIDATWHIEQTEDGADE